MQRLTVEWAKRAAAGMHRRTRSVRRGDSAKPNPQGAQVSARRQICQPSELIQNKERKTTMKLQEAIKGMGVKSWERRENSSGKCTVYVRFVPKSSAPTVSVKEVS